MAEFFQGQLRTVHSIITLPHESGFASYLGIKIITLTTPSISKREQRITLCDSTAVVVKSAQRFLVTRHSTYFNNIIIFFERDWGSITHHFVHTFFFLKVAQHIFLVQKSLLMSALLQGTNQGKFL